MSFSSTRNLRGFTTWNAIGKSVSQGVEAEVNFVLGCGFNLYVNASMGGAKYEATGLSIQNASKETESLGLYYQQDACSVGLLAKRVDKLFNDNRAIH